MLRYCDYHSYLCYVSILRLVLFGISFCYIFYHTLYITIHKEQKEMLFFIKGKVETQYLQHSCEFHVICFQPESLLSSTDSEREIHQGDDGYVINFVTTSLRLENLF